MEDSPRPLPACPVCGNRPVLEFHDPTGVALCPWCGGLLRRLRERLAALHGTEASRVTLDSWLEAIGFDSLDMVELVMELEEEFDVTIPDEEAEQIKTVADLLRAIARHRRRERAWPPSRSGAGP